jgi:TRAP-type C4-dicarboxylate transport system permease small subunit
VRARTLAAANDPIRHTQDEIPMRRAVELYFTLLKIILGFCMVAMVVLVFGNVVLRYALNAGITASEELSRLFFVWMVFLGAIIAMREHAHLGVDFVVRALPTLGRKVCLIISQLLMLWACWLFLEGSWNQTLINLDVASPAVGFSMALVYGVGIIFSFSTGLIILYDLYRVLSGQLTGDDLVMVKESEEAEELEELEKTLAHRPDSIVPAPGSATDRR